MRRIPRLLVVVPTSLLLLAPVGAAHAAKANPWSAYYPAKGVTCTSTATHADGTTTTVRETVLAKTATKVMTRVTGQGRTTFQLLPGGKLKQVSSETDQDSGMLTHLDATATFPSPATLLHHGRGSGEMTMTMTVPERDAKMVLTHGRTLTMRVTARFKGLGSRTITLADPAATTVDALGIRTSIGAFTVSNVKPAFKHRLMKVMRSVFVGPDETQWVAKGRDVVEDDTTDDDGSALTIKQVSCG